MAKIYRHVASGIITSANSGTSPTIEIWACTLHSLQPDSAGIVTVSSYFANGWETFFQEPTTKVSATVLTTLVKTNEIDPATGLQITDPTNQAEVSYRGGSSSSYPPTFLSSRVSIDNGTRNRKARGGFYLPRFTGALGANGRFSPEDMVNVANNARTLLNGLGTTGGLPNAGIYSRASGGFFPATRVRVGDVPDVIRKRKNALDESYSVAVL